MFAANYKDVSPLLQLQYHKQDHEDNQNKAAMETVLAVSDINFDPALVTDISQLSAEEFLLYVRYEADQCPGVVRAPVDSDQFKGCQTEYMPKVVDIPTCHEMFLPSSEWENEVVDAFSRFRQV